MKILPANRTHVDALVPLCAQLGYPVPADELERRLEILGRDPDQVVLVGVIEGKVVGFGQARLVRGLVYSVRNEIAALVVDEKLRSKGIGRQLLEALEAWGKVRGCPSLRVSSQMARKEAHRFYEREGYVRTKISHIYEKKEPEPARAPALE